MRKIEDNDVKARQRHADAKLFPEAFFHALKPFMSPRGKISPTTALKNLKAAFRDTKSRAEILGKAPGWDGRIPCVKTIYNRITAGRSCAGMDASWLPVGWQSVNVSFGNVYAEPFPFFGYNTPKVHPCSHAVVGEISPFGLINILST